MPNAKTDFTVRDHQMPKKISKSIPEEWLDLAREQAKYIHRSDEIAEKIVLEAGSRLRVMSKKQSKRLFFRSKHPARIHLKDLHLFQLLVFICSEDVESTQEILFPASIRESDLIVRYIAFIVRKSLLMNSFYGVTGICRFICRYELDHVRRIHDALFDVLDKVNGDDDYRRNRTTLREMIRTRFSKYLRLEEHGKGREKHFQLRDNQADSSLWGLVSRSLDSFQPWETKCIPRDFNPKDENRTAFSHASQHESEIKRLHALIHQDCLRILTDALGCPPPNFVLGIPQFVAASSISNGPLHGPSNSVIMPHAHDDNSGYASLQKLEALQRALIEQSEKLAKFVPGDSLTVKVDGKAVASLNLDGTSSVRFTLHDEDAELIEVVSEKDQLVLGVHLLDEETWQSQNREHFYVVRRHTGPRIVFGFRRIENAGVGNNQLSVVVTYEKTRLTRSFAFLKQRIEHWLLSLRVATANSVAFLLPSRLRAPVLAGRYSRLVLTSLFMVALVPVVLFLLFGPLSFRRNVETTRETNANSIVLQGTPPAIAQTGRSTTSSDELPKLVHRKHNVREPWAKPTTLEYQPIARPLLPVGKISQGEPCSRCIVHWTLMNRTTSAERLIDN